MQKHIIPVLTSFSGVIIAIMIGVIIAYNTNIIPTLEEELAKEKESSDRKDQNIARLQEEVDFAQAKQFEAEDKLKIKLAEEEAAALERARQAQLARIAAEEAAAEAARIAAKEASEASKKTRAS